MDSHSKMRNKVLLLLNTELKIQIIIGTYSPYFLKAADYDLKEQGNTSNGRYYLPMICGNIEHSE